MPLDQAVLDYQVVAASTGAEGERQMDVVAVAARRDMVSGAARRPAQRRPAAGRDRPLGLRHDPRARRRRRAAPTMPERPPWRRPRSTATSATSPTSPSRAARTACSPASRPFGVEAIAAAARRARGDAARGRPRVAARGRARGADRRTSATTATSAEAAREALERGRRASWSTSFALSLEFYGAQEGAAADRARRRLRPRQHDPGPARASPERPRPARSSSDARRRSRHLDDEDAARLTVSYGLALEAVGDAPRQPDPAEEPAAATAHPMRTGGVRLRHARRARARRCSA